MDISTIANLGVGVGTFALAATTGWLGWLTKRSVEQNERSRIDSRAPRFIVSRWWADQIPLAKADAPEGEDQPFTPGTEVVQGERTPLMIVRCYIVLRNEGASSGFLLVETNPANSTLRWRVGKAKPNPMPDDRPLRIAPGEELELVFDGARPPQDWGAAWEKRRGGRYQDHALNLVLTVTDQFATGITDTTRIEILALPVDNTSIQKNSWRVRSIQDFERTQGSVAPFATFQIDPTVRNYR